MKKKTYSTTSHLICWLYVDFYLFPRQCLSFEKKKKMELINEKKIYNKNTKI